MGPANLGQVRRAPYGNRQNTRFDDEDLAAWELTQFREAGGKTVVDQTMPDMGRDLPGLVRIALRTGVHIVAGCGCSTSKRPHATWRAARWRNSPPRSWPTC